MFWQTRVSYEFGPFRVDARERQLLREAQVVPLTPKVFDILLVLVQNAGHILSKTEMIKLIWPDTSVEEGNLARNISTLRGVLGEQPREYQYIETIPWRGYRFVAPVKEVRDESDSRPFDSIAVLPFTNTIRDPHLEFLSDGITESLINSLAQLSRLKVMSRNAVFRYRDCDIDASEVGRALNVEGVIFGRITKQEDLLAISVELVDTSDNSYVWGAQHVRQYSDILTMPEEIAGKLADKLRLDLTSDERRRLSRRQTANTEAYQLYLKGRYYFNKLTLEGVRKGTDLFTQAIDRDPNYALAYAGLGDCHNYLANRDDAKKAVHRALELDPALGEAHASLGFFRFLYDWDFAGAESEFAQALRLSPNCAEAHHWYGIYLANLGRHDEASKQAEMSVERDPLSLLMNMTAALNFYLARDYDRAVAQLHKVIEMESNFIAARSVLGCVYVQKEMYQEALSEYQTVLALSKGVNVVEASVKVLMAQAYARWGKKTDALRLLTEATAQGLASDYSVAGVHAALGKRENAFQALNKAYEQRDMQMVSLKVDPTLDEVRADVRFAELVRRVGLPN